MGRGRGRRAVPSARLLGALRYPRSGLRRPGPSSRWGPERRRASAREGARAGARGGGRPAPRRRSHGGAPRLRAEDQQVRGGEAGRGLAGWEGGCGAAPRAWPRHPGPAARASPGPQGVRQPGGSLCPQSSPPRRSTPTPLLPAPQQKELARRPRRSRPHPPPPLTAPGVPGPHQRLCTRACTRTQRPQCKVAGCGTPEHPASPVGSVGVLSLAPEEDGWPDPHCALSMGLMFTS